MSQTQKNRSKLMIDAVVKAAAAGLAPAPCTPGKLAAIAGLAGFVLRLFRTRDLPASPPRGKRPRKSTAAASPAAAPRRGSGRPPKPAARFQQGSSKAVRRNPPPHPTGFPEANGTASAANRGGVHHG